MISLALLLAHSALPQEPDAAPQQSMALISLRPFVTQPPKPETPLFGTMLPEPENDEESLDLLHPFDRGLWSADHIENLLQLSHMEACDNGLLQLEVTGNSLMLQAEDELLAEVTRDIKAALAIVARPIEITASIFAIEDGMPTETILHPDQLRELEQSGQRLWQDVTTTRSAVRTGFNSLRWTRYVRHTEVEVAQDSSIAIPVDAVFAEGVRITVLPHSTINSEDIVLQTQFSISDRRSLENTSTGAQRHPNIDLPQIESAFGAVGARVSSGHGMAVELSGAHACGSRLLLVVSARYPTPPAADTVGDMLIAPVSALSNSALPDVWLVPSSPQTEDREEEPYSLPEVPRIAFSEFGPLEELLQRVVEDSEGVSLSVHADSFVFLSAPAPLREQARSVLEALQNRLVRNVAVHCSVTAHEVDSASALAKEVRGGAQRTLHDVALPCLAGRTSVLFRGIEENAIQQLECEIAQEASILNPRVHRQSSGLWVIACPTPTSDGIDCDMTLQFTYQDPTERRALTPSGMLMLNQSNTLRAQPRQRFTEQPLEVATGTSLTLDDSFWRPRLTVACK